MHHLELKKAVDELFRVLKPTGLAIFAEPLGTNPIVNLYRRFTPNYRTEDEAPLDLEVFKKILSAFSSVEHFEYYFISLVPLALANIKGMLGIAEAIFKSTMILDESLLRVLPFLRKYAWYSIIVIKK